MNVAGIDFSSLAIDIVLVDLDYLAPPVWHRFPLVGQDAFDRTRSVRQAMPLQSTWDDTYAIGIEHPAGKFGTGPMMRIQGAVLACLPPGVLVQPWPPGAWRKTVGLPGNASKHTVAFYVKTDSAASTGFAVGWTQDACDAYCIALATRAALDRETAA